MLKPSLRSGAAAIVVCGSLSALLIRPTTSTASVQSAAANLALAGATAAPAPTAPPKAADPFVAAPCTDIAVVSARPGYIYSATAGANLRSVGTPTVNNITLAEDEPIGVGDTVDLGMLRNAGSTPVTVTFSSRQSIRLEPGEVAFTSSQMSLQQIVEGLQFSGWTCECRCICQGCNGAQFVVPCGSPPSDCSFNGDPCHINNCNGELANCKRHWIYHCN